jgi:hypothetical protein
MALINVCTLGTNARTPGGFSPRQKFEPHFAARFLIAGSSSESNFARFFLRPARPNKPPLLVGITTPRGDGRRRTGRFGWTGGSKTLAPPSLALTQPESYPFPLCTRRSAGPPIQGNAHEVTTSPTPWFQKRHSYCKKNFVKTRLKPVRLRRRTVSVHQSSWYSLPSRAHFPPNLSRLLDGLREQPPQPSYLTRQQLYRQMFLTHACVAGAPMPTLLNTA